MHHFLLASKILEGAAVNTSLFDLPGLGMLFFVRLIVPRGQYML
jgi:hypothetical protein